MKLTTVVDCRKALSDVYIGRPGRNYPSHLLNFGNPFSVKTYGRELCLELFKTYFDYKMANDAAYREAIHGLRGKALGCWCHPQKCHGDIIADYLNKL